MSLTNLIDLTLLNQPIEGVSLEEDKAFYESYLNKKSLRTSLNGSWKILYQKVFDEFVLEKDFNTKDLKEIILPSHIELNGFQKPQYVNYMYPWEGKENLKIGELPKTNPSATLVKVIEISDLDFDYYLELNGFEGGLYLYLNNHFVGYSTKNYTNSRFLLNNYLTKGKNEIKIIIFNYCFTSWVNDQDMWRFFGIHRDINLLRLPKLHFDNIENYSLLNKNLRDGDFELKFRVNSIIKGSTISLSLSFKGKTIFNESVPVNNKLVTYKKTLYDVFKWSDEEPNLYDVKIKLKEGKDIKEEVVLKTGFRRIDIENGQILLNGKKVIFRGVNRHEFDCNTGRAISKETTFEDLKLLKRNNFNAVRTSHYPNINEFYDYCDELGLLVIDETAIETHGLWIFKNSRNLEFDLIPGSDIKYLDFTIDRGKTMMKRDFNHPCIISWSLGNESYEGRNFEGLYNYFKENDPSRFVHYESCYFLKGRKPISDVISKMYFKPLQMEKLCKKHPNEPVMLCEYAHSMGNSNGNLDEYINLLDNHSNFHLGFIWDFVDQGLKISDKFYYGGDFNDYPNDDNFCANGILLADRKPTSKLDTIKYFYSCLKIDIENERIIIKNNYNFKNTSKYKFLYQLFEDDHEIISKSFECNIAPGEEKEIPIKNKNFLSDREYIGRVSVFLKEDELYGPKGTEIFSEEKFLQGSLETTFNKMSTETNGELEIFSSVTHVTVQNGNHKFIFNGIMSKLGGLEAIMVDDKLYLQHVVMPTLYRATIDNDAMMERYFNSSYLSNSYNLMYLPKLSLTSINTHKVSKDKVVVSFKYVVVNGIRSRFFNVDYTVNSSNELKVDFNFKKSILSFSPLLVGLKFKFPKEICEFDYLGLGKGDNYPDRLKGNKFGRYQSTVKDEYVPYSIPQDCGNHEYTKEININVYDKKMSFYALDKSFAFKFLPYSEFELEIAHRNEELTHNFNYLTIIAKNKGVGGDDSWGAKTHNQYYLKFKKYSQSFFIKIH